MVKRLKKNHRLQTDFEEGKILGSQCNKYEYGYLLGRGVTTGWCGWQNAKG
jgi:hypothetical protein